MASRPRSALACAPCSFPCVTPIPIAKPLPTFPGYALIDVRFACAWRTVWRQHRGAVLGRRLVPYHGVMRDRAEQVAVLPLQCLRREQHAPAGIVEQPR